MKKIHLFGTMCAVMGLLFATGETIVNGILAVVFMGVAAYLLRDFAQGASSAGTTELRKRGTTDYPKAA